MKPNKKGFSRFEMEFMSFPFAFKGVSYCHRLLGDVGNEKHILAVYCPMGVYNGFLAFRNL